MITDDMWIPEPNSGCWLWLRAINGGGYGNIWVDGVWHRAHRASYEQHKGKISEGMVLDHKCRNRGCINPDHLEVVTNIENIRRGDVGKHNAAKTHCAAGHEYSASNTVRNASGYRECRTCMRLQSRERTKNYRQRQLLKKSYTGGSPASPS